MEKVGKDMSDKPDYLTSLWSWYGKWMNESFVKKTLKNKVFIILAWLPFQIGAITDWLLNHLDED